MQEFNSIKEIRAAIDLSESLKFKMHAYSMLSSAYTTAFAWEEVTKANLFKDVYPDLVEEEAPFEDVFGGRFVLLETKEDLQLLLDEGEPIILDVADKVAVSLYCLISISNNEGGTSYYLPMDLIKEESFVKKMIDDCSEFNKVNGEENAD